jgi:two-component system, NtrC family, response regulator AtoC
MLTSYDWPGNVRELRNVIERAALLANDGEIRREHVMLEPSATEPEEAGGFEPDDFDAVTSVFSQPPPRGGSTPDTERDRIIRALETCGGNQTRAAKVLGMSRRTLIKRLEEFNLPRPKKG